MRSYYESMGKEDEIGTEASNRIAKMLHFDRETLPRVQTTMDHSEGQGIQL